jgi:hypothetical protein
MLLHFSFSFKKGTYMNHALSLMALLIAYSGCTVSKPLAAFCTVPVADLLSQKLSLTGHPTVEEKYTLLPLSEKQPVCLCCRATQLLFNERVTIIEQQGEQSYVEASFWHLKNSTFHTPSTRNNRFWTLTKNLKPLQKLTSEEQAAIPLTDPEKSHGKMVTLILPWQCPQTHTSYSAGTQFVMTRLEHNQYQIKIYHPCAAQVIETAVPQDLCVLNKKRTPQEKRELFLTTLQRWARGIPHSVPYVLGGASIIQTFTQSSFREKKMVVGKTKGTVFVRSECSATPHTGVDCAGLIRLGCKIAGIPLNATNSKSIAQSLFKVDPPTTLHNGDLLFWKGHIAVISDSKRGLLLEARGYEQGYGLVHEIPYHVELRGITTTTDLMNAYSRKKPIQRLDNQGRYRETILDLTILSLMPIKPTPWMK